jgi:hypothetical protein
MRSRTPHTSRTRAPPTHINSSSGGSSGAAARRRCALCSCNANALRPRCFHRRNTHPAHPRPLFKERSPTDPSRTLVPPSKKNGRGCCVLHHWFVPHVSFVAPIFTGLYPVARPHSFPLGAIIIGICTSMIYGYFVMKGEHPPRLVRSQLSS